MKDILSLKNNSPPIDYPEALKTVGGEESFLEELLSCFNKDFSLKCITLKKAIDKKNFNVISELGHSLRGSSDNLSLKPLHESSLQLEIAGKEENIDKVNRAFSLLEHEFRRLQDFLSNKAYQGHQSDNRETEREDFLSKISSEKSRISSGLRILVVDDSVDNQMLLQTFTKQAAIELDIANNGKEAIEFFQKKTYSLILLDIHMPEMNGFEALKEMRNIEKDAALSSTPIIALTGTSSLKDKTRCHSLGFTDYVEKPIKKDKIMKIIHKYLGTSHNIPPAEVIIVDESIKDLVPGYLKKRGNDVEKMNSALGKNDFSTIESIAHMIKGSGESYGFKKISQISKQIEKSAQENNHEKIKHLLEKFKNYLDDIHYE